MNLSKRMTSIVCAFLMLFSIFLSKPLSVKAETEPSNLEILSSSIANNQEGAPRTLEIKLTTNIPIVYVWPDKEDYSLKDSKGNLYECEFNYDDREKQIFVYPKEVLAPGENYVLELIANAFTVNNDNTTGVTLADKYVLSFKTRDKNMVKIGPNGDYADLKRFEVLSDMNDMSAGLEVRIAKGSYKFHGAGLGASSMSFLGGYNEDFTAQDYDSPTELINEDLYMFEITRRLYEVEQPPVKFQFNNLKFTQKPMTEGDEADNSFVPILIDYYFAHNLTVDVEKCIFSGLSGSTPSYSETVSMENPSPITAVMHEGVLNLNVSQSSFLNNNYYKGGSAGIFAYSGSRREETSKVNLTVTNSIFANNKGNGAGGILALNTVQNGMNVKLYNNTITKNIANSDGSNSDFISNSGGVALVTLNRNSSMAADFKNNIIWENKVSNRANDVLLYAEEFEGAEATKIECNMHSNNIGKLYSAGNNNPNPLQIVITRPVEYNTDPLFEDMAAGNFHLSAESPMIDAGIEVPTVTNDFEGNQRPRGDAYDVGAYEVAGTLNPISRIGFEVASIDVDEAAGKAVATVVRKGSFTGRVSVDYATSDGTAKASEDYTAKTGTLVFEDDMISRQILIPILNDTAVEGDEQFKLTLSNPSEGAILDEITTFTVNIKSEDVVLETPDAVLGFAVSSMDIDEAGGKAVVTVNRTGSSEGKVTVNFGTVDGTAKSGEDYTAASGTLTFEDKETSKTFEIAITNDTSIEQDEKFNVTLSSPSEGAKLGEITTLTINIKSEDKNTIPQTGTFIDGTLLGFIGLALIIAGVFFIRRKKVINK